MFVVDNFSYLSQTSFYGIIAMDLYPQSSLMPTFDPDYTRIMDHALRIMGTFLGNYRWNFENLRIALWAKTCMRIIYLALTWSPDIDRKLICRHGNCKQFTWDDMIVIFSVFSSLTCLIVCAQKCIINKSFLIYTHFKFTLSDLDTSFDLSFWIVENLCFKFTHMINNASPGWGQ